MRDIFTPFAPISLEELQAYLHRESGATDADKARIVRSGNHALGHMERDTRRRLVARTYRTAAAVASCVLATGDVAVTGSGFTSLYAGDAVVGVGLQPGTQVASIESASALTLDRAAEVGGTVTLTFGSERFAVDGNATDTIQFPEYPVSAVYSVASLDGSGNETAIDTTSYRLEKHTGRLHLPNSRFPAGTLNILIACKAGYEEPTATNRGDFTEWMDLQRLFCRLSQVYFQDEDQQPGRVVDKKLIQSGGTIPDFRLPQDIRDLLNDFRRLWG